MERHPDSTCYHLKAWKVVAQNAYRIEAPFLLAREKAGAEICGALPLFLVRGSIRSHLTNGLFGAYGSILADQEIVRQELIKKAKKILESEGLSVLILKCLKSPSMPTSLELQYCDFWEIATLVLDPDPQQVWESLRDKIRNCVRKAIKFKLELRTGRSQLRAFYDVLADNMHQKGAPIYGFHFMNELMEAMEGRVEIMTLWDRDKVVSGALILDHRDTTYVPFASSRPSSLHMSPNNLLYWEIIKRSCLKGMKLLDFGRSLKNSGPLAFKVGWGAKTISQSVWVYTPQDRRNQKLDLGDRRVKWFVRQWKRLPRPVADALGPAVCKRFAGLI